MSGTCKKCKGMTTNTRERGIGLCFNCEYGLAYRKKEDEGMSCTVEHRRLYCTTADVSFGPLFESDEEGEEFRAWMYREQGDPRQFDSDALQEFYSTWRRRMSHKTELLPRMDGESLTDWTLRFLADGRRRLQNTQELWRAVGVTNCTCENNGDYCDYCEGHRVEDDRRRMDDLYRACTPREAEFAEPGED